MNEPKFINPNNEHPQVHRYGYSMYEFLLVAVTIIFLSALVLFLIQPLSQFAEIRNTQRIADLNQILDAINQFQLEQGSLQELGSIEQCPNYSEFGTANGNINPYGVLIDEYLVYLPVDPQGSEETTGYQICIQPTSKRIQLKAKLAERGEIISVIR